jgi:hypothetical protein
VPVTTRLLQRLQETLGDEATNDLFAWFDEAGWVNRAAVREVADLYFDRFEVRLEQGLEGLRTTFTARLEQELGALRAEFRTELARESARLEAMIANQRADLLKWMFIFWAGTVIPLAGLIVAVSRP